MATTRKISGLLFGLLAFGLAACSSNSNSVNGISAEKADKLDAMHGTDDAAIGTKSVTAATRYAAGQFAESQARPDKAIDQYRKSLELDPKYQPSLYRLAIVYCELNRFVDAENTWHRYIELTKTSALGWSNLGFTFELAGRPEEAQDAYQRGIAVDPKSVPCRVNYGLMLARHGHMGQATIQLQAVLTPAEVHYNLASIYEIEGRGAQAKEEYQKALDLDPGLTDAQTRLDAMAD
jgi:tetratricopeptide (TPR) repeat protein